METYIYQTAADMNQVIRAKHARWAMSQADVNELLSLESKLAYMPISLNALKILDRIDALERK